MKVLIVANYNPGYFASFVLEQVASLKKEGVEVEMYGIVGKGITGYLKNIRGIRQMIKRFKPDIVHAHYGLSGLCANLQRGVPVVTTYHGSDVHNGGWVLKLSQLAMKLSAYNIFVNRKMWEMSRYDKVNYCVLPCGIDLTIMTTVLSEEAKRKSGFNEPFVLFSGFFSNDVKNYPLAKAAMEQVNGVRLVELRGYSRQQVNLLMNAAGCLLMTSFREGSPQVVKEAMACGTPVVSVDVGDVKEVMGNTAGCYIAERTPDDIAEKVKMALAFHGKTNGRQRIIELGLDNMIVAKRLIHIYKQVLSK